MKKVIYTEYAQTGKEGLISKEEMQTLMAETFSIQPEQIYDSAILAIQDSCGEMESSEEKRKEDRDKTLTRHYAGQTIKIKKNDLLKQIKSHLMATQPKWFDEKMAWEFLITYKHMKNNNRQ